MFPEANEDVKPWVCKCRKRTFKGVTTRECRKNGYLVAECTDPIPTMAPGAPLPTWPPSWNVNKKPDRISGFETNDTTQNSSGYTCVCRNGTKVENGTLKRIRHCIKNGCLVNACQDPIDMNNCTIVESWNKCECNLVRRNGTFVKECRLQGKVVDVCPQDDNATVQTGINALDADNVTDIQTVTQTPTMLVERPMFLETIQDSPGKPLEAPGEGLHFRGGSKTEGEGLHFGGDSKIEDPLVHFEDWEDEEVSDFVSDLVS